MDIDTSRLRTDLPQVGVQPYRQVHAHSTGNRNSTAQNEADYHYRKDPELGFFFSRCWQWSCHAGRTCKQWLMGRWKAVGMLKPMQQ